MAMPTISISLDIDFLYKVDTEVKKMQLEHPRAKISRNMVIRHYIERGIVYSNMLEKAKIDGKVVKIVEGS